MKSKGVVEQLAINLKVFIDNKKVLTEIIENAFCLESRQISNRDIETLQEQLRKKGIDKFVKQFRQFGHLGFTPYILEV